MGWSVADIMNREGLCVGYAVGASVAVSEDDDDDFLLHPQSSLLLLSDEDEEEDSSSPSSLLLLLSTDSLSAAVKSSSGADTEWVVSLPAEEVAVSGVMRMG